jgi:RHS repeat-associated protein
VRPYDVFGNLKQATLPNGDVVDYNSDGMDRRAHKKVNGSFKWRYLYEDQYRVAAIIDSSSVLKKTFVYATHVNVPDYMSDGTDEYRIITDHLGSPRLVVKVTDGTVAQRMDYNVLGEVKADTNQGFQPFGFAGGIYEPATKLVRFGTRDYDPRACGRWTTKDPIRFDGGNANLYGYVMADPVNFRDITGRGPISGGLFCAGLTSTVTTSGLFLIMKEFSKLYEQRKLDIEKVRRENDCEIEQEIKISKIDEKYQYDVLRLLVGYGIPSVGLDAVVAMACIAAIASPSP